MQQIEGNKGLYLLEETMPCSPRRISVGRYAIFSTLGRSEKEEAAARVLFPSVELGQWVGISWKRICQIMRDDYNKFFEVSEAREYNRKEELRAAKEMVTYRKWRFWTLGIYTWFVKKPMAQLRAVNQAGLVFTTIVIQGPDEVVRCTHELIEEGLLLMVSEGEGETALDVLFPTPALISIIMEKQRVMMQ